MCRALASQQNEVSFFKTRAFSITIQFTGLVNRDSSYQTNKYLPECSYLLWRVNELSLEKLLSHFSSISCGKESSSSSILIQLRFWVYDTVFFDADRHSQLGRSCHGPYPFSSSFSTTPGVSFNCGRCTPAFDSDSTRLTVRSNGCSFSS